MSNGVGADVRTDRRQLVVVLRLEQACLEPSLEEMPTAVVAGVEPLRVQEAEPVHPLRQRALLGLDDEVEVVSEQAPGVRLPAEELLHLSTPPREHAPVEIVAHDRNVIDPSLRHVEDPVRRQHAAG